MWPVIALLCCHVACHRRIKKYHLRKAYWSWHSKHRKATMADVHPLAQMLFDHSRKEEQVLALFLKPIESSGLCLSPAAHQALSQ